MVLPALALLCGSITLEPGWTRAVVSTTQVNLQLELSRAHTPRAASAYI